VRKYYFIFFFIILSNTTFSKGVNIEYTTINSIPYLRLLDLKKIESAIKIDTDKLTLTSSISYHGKSVRIQADMNFFTTGDDIQYNITEPPVVYLKEIYISRSLAEEIFTELSLPAKYFFAGEGVELQVNELSDQRSQGFDFIVIDPGHGGKDPGAFGKGSTIEKEITLDLAKYLFFYLKKKFPGVRIYITRFDDSFVSLEGRSDIANRKLEKHSRGIFISIHCNATLQSSVHGYEVFYLAQNIQNEAERQTMMRENKVIQGGNPDVARFESYLYDSMLLYQSKMLAREVDRHFMEKMDTLVSSRGVKKANFVVLRNTIMPAILVETGYISNTNEAGVLKSSKYKEVFAEALANALESFIKKGSHR